MNKEDDYMSEFFKSQSDIITALINTMPFESITAIYLFGSYAKGTNIYNSDIDLIVVSNCFDKLCGYLRSKIVLSLLKETHPKIDVICLTEKEFYKYRKSAAVRNESLKLLYGKGFQ